MKKISEIIDDIIKKLEDKMNILDTKIPNFLFKFLEKEKYSEIESEYKRIDTLCKLKGDFENFQKIEKEYVEILSKFQGLDQNAIDYFEHAFKFDIATQLYTRIDRSEGMISILKSVVEKQLEDNKKKLHNSELDKQENFSDNISYQLSLQETYKKLYSAISVIQEDIKSLNDNDDDKAHLIYINGVFSRNITFHVSYFIEFIKNLEETEKLLKPTIDPNQAKPGVNEILAQLDGKITPEEEKARRNKKAQEDNKISDIINENFDLFIPKNTTTKTKNSNFIDYYNEKNSASNPDKDKKLNIPHLIETIDGIIKGHQDRINKIKEETKILNKLAKMVVGSILIITGFIIFVPLARKFITNSVNKPSKTPTNSTSNIIPFPNRANISSSSHLMASK